jgi:hypothetical protein
LTLGRYDFRNKKVGVIGGGSSSIQIVPCLQRLEGVKMNCFVRSKTLISNPFGEMSMEKLGLDPTIFECKLFPSSQLDKLITHDIRREFEANPEAYFKFRKVIEQDGNLMHPATLACSDVQKGAVEAFRP